MSSSPPCDSGQLNILHLAALVGRRSGGLGPVAIGFTREQRILGHQSAVWCLDSPADAVEVARESGLEGSIVTYQIRGPSWVGYSPTMEQVAISPRGAAYDILHQHGIWMANSRVTNRWRAAFGRPTVVAPHGALKAYALRRSAWKKRLAALAYEKKNLRAASCLQATSFAEATSLRRYGLNNPIAIIPDGIPETWIQGGGNADRFRSKFSIPPDRRLLLFLSRIHPIKGLPLLFEAIAPIRRQLTGWHLVVAGPDERGHRHELALILERLEIGDVVQFVGPLFGSDKRDAFAAADLFVLPTHSENFALVVAEALGAGVPVLTTRGAPWEELQTYRCGWWVEVNTEAIRDSLSEAIQHPGETLRAMGQRGKTLVAERYTWPLVAQRSLMLYQWLSGRAQRPDFVITD